MRVLTAGLFLAACAGSGDKGTTSTAPPGMTAGGTASGSTSAGSVGGAPSGSTTPTPLEDCANDLIPALPWLTGASQTDLSGSLELGQTHVVNEVETRLAPRVTAERATLLLFTPDSALDPATDLRIRAMDQGTPLGVLPMRPPAALPTPLEAEVSSVPLDPYSTEAWSVQLPWSWVREGVAIEIGHEDGGVNHVRTHVFTDLGSPQVFTVNRTKIVLFGDETWDTRTLEASHVARDYFPTVPGAELRFVDSNDWILDEIVVPTPTGPQLVSSEAERIAVSSEVDHWSILKHQTALRLSLANTGRGLTLTGESQGDSSPYSSGTSVAMGWFVDPDGNYVDIDDAPWAAGWTGWTAMWADECGNAFIHEVGHSFTLEHFTAGTASGWGIGGEYPIDGTHVDTHPWGYDSVRDRIRTWYRVDASGPVDDGNGWVGKNDPMNGGESPNAASCFPQYTPYHAQKTQAWMQDSPVIAEINGVPGVYRWDSTTHAYVQEAAQGQEPIAVDVPVVTLIGALAGNGGPSRTYPPVVLPLGNAFELPDPNDPGLPVDFTGARYFLEIETSSGVVERALIARPQILDTALYLYSVNLPASDPPVRVDLYESPTAWPGIDVAGATLLHHADFVEREPTGDRVHIGRGALGNGPLRLTERCEPGVNCDRRWVESTWRLGTGQLHFGDLGGQVPSEDLCTAPGDHTELVIPVVDEGGAAHSVTVHAQRVVRTGDTEFAVPLHDATPWIESPGVEQSLRVWLPWSSNSALPEGRYRTDPAFDLRAFLDGTLHDELVLEVDLTVMPTTAVDLSTEFLTSPLTTADSSMYFLLTDPAIGPTERVWWGDYDPVPLFVPVVDSSGAASTLVVDGLQESCGSRWQLNAGRGAGNCDHQAVLAVDPADNPGLTSGETYQTPPSAPLVLEGRRWHDPNGEALIGTFALDLSYPAP